MAHLAHLAHSTFTKNSADAIVESLADDSSESRSLKVGVTCTWFRGTVQLGVNLCLEEKVGVGTPLASGLEDFHILNNEKWEGFEIKLGVDICLRQHF